MHKKESSLFAFFVDLKAAFDTVDTEKIWEYLKKKKISEHLIDRIEELYENTTM